MSDSDIDWAAAVKVGQRVAPSGPGVTKTQAREVVSDLRRFAARAELQVRETTGLGLDLPVGEASVVDRPTWVAAAAEGMAELTRPLSERLLSSHQDGAAASAPVGVLLGLMSSRVLGQYDPVAPGGGRLLLVAPNVIKVEREIAADPADFRLWVCLHESTHRLQFSAVEWMVDYFRSLIDEYAAVAPKDSKTLAEQIKAALRGGRDRDGRDSDAKRGGRDHEAGGRRGGRHSAPADTPFTNSWLRRAQTPEQQQVFDKIMALMTLLEGHADYVMDAVGPTIIPSVRQIRDAFSERRRKGRGPIDRLVRALLGMDTKMAQYARGAAFVRGVVDQVGMARFNDVFASAETLPTIAEIERPHAWVARVHGPPSP